MIIEGAVDTALAAYLDAHGQPKTREEVEEFASSLEETSPYDNPEMREWYAGEVSKLRTRRGLTIRFSGWFKNIRLSSIAPLGAITELGH